MKRVFQTISWIALAGTILPSFMYLGGMIDLDQANMILLLATLAWFVHTPLWMGKNSQTA